MANFCCVDSETSNSSVITKIPISDVLEYGQSHCDINFKLSPTMCRSDCGTVGCQ